MKLALAYAAVIVVIALAYQIKWPRCEANSPHGPRIGGAILIGGCP